MAGAGARPARRGGAAEAAGRGRRGPRKPVCNASATRSGCAPLGLPRRRMLRRPAALFALFRRRPARAAQPRRTRERPRRGARARAPGARAAQAPHGAGRALPPGGSGARCWTPGARCPCARAQRAGPGCAEAPAALRLRQPRRVQGLVARQRGHLLGGELQRQPVRQPVRRLHSGNGGGCCCHCCRCCCFWCATAIPITPAARLTPPGVCAATNSSGGGKVIPTPTHFLDRISPIPPPPRFFPFFALFHRLVETVPTSHKPEPRAKKQPARGPFVRHRRCRGNDHLRAQRRRDVLLHDVPRRAGQRVGVAEVSRPLRPKAHG